MSSPLVRSGAVLFAAALLLACVSVAQVKQSAVDAAISTAAPHPAPPPPPPAALAGYSIFAGDFHTHVAPPDGPPHVVRGMHETVELARKEHLDFVVLTPHTWSRFFVSSSLRAQFVKNRNEMRRALAAEDTGDGTSAALPQRGQNQRVLFIVGAEYTDGAYGHVGMAFGDLDQTLAEVDAKSASAHTDAFFEHYVASGGLLTINHPLVGPIDSTFEIARADLSWRMYTAPGDGAGAAGADTQGQEFPPEVRAVTRLSILVRGLQHHRDGAARSHSALRPRLDAARDACALRPGDRARTAALHARRRLGQSQPGVWTLTAQNAQLELSLLLSQVLPQFV